MTHVFLEMTMTVDGFTAAVGVSLEHPFGLDGERVHSWMRDSVFAGRRPATTTATVSSTTPAKRSIATPSRSSYESTGAFVLGRRTLDVREAVWGDEPVFQGRPCFVVTSRPHEPYVRGGSRYEFVTGGVAEAIARASAAASAASVCVIGGADVARQALALGLVDEALPPHRAGAPRRRRPALSRLALRTAWSSSRSPRSRVHGRRTCATGLPTVRG